MILSLFITSFISLFALINPLSALPVFISLTDGNTNEWRDSQIKKTCLYIIVICVSSYFIGTHILNFFGISINALKIAGGIIISRSGFLLLNAQHKRDVSDKIREESMDKQDISFSPLAMPLLSGPGSMSLLINMSIENKGLLSKNLVVIAAIIAVVICIYIIFSIAPKILKSTGQAGLTSISKIMGFLVLAIGIEMTVGSLMDMLKPHF